jgi:hypothetical protein
MNWTIEKSCGDLAKRNIYARWNREISALIWFYLQDLLLVVSSGAVHISEFRWDFWMAYPADFGIRTPASTIKLTAKVGFQ